MTVFELMLYACLTSNAFDGIYSKTCAWHSRGEFYVSNEQCEVAGKRYIGADIIGDTMYANATHKYENVNCVGHHVAQ